MNQKPKWLIMIMIVLPIKKDYDHDHNITSYKKDLTL